MVLQREAHALTQRDRIRPRPGTCKPAGRRLDSPQHMASSLDRDKAWMSLVTNVAVLPGLGSYLAGKRWTGILQAALATLGFVLTMSWVWAIAAAWYRSGEYPGVTPGLATGMKGLLLFALAWVWSLLSGLAALRESSRKGPPGVTQPFPRR